MISPTSTTTVKYYSADNIFGCKTAAPAPCNAPQENYKMIRVEKQETKECAMNCNQDTRTEAQQAKDYLIRSLDQAIDTHQTKAIETFNLQVPTFKTFGELRAALADGWFQVNGERKDEAKISCWQSVFELVKIEDPKNPRNTDGYEAAIKQISVDAAAVKDQIVVFGAEKGLEALNVFKAKEYK